MLALNVELHLVDALGHVLACLDRRTVRVLAIHGDGHLEGLLEDPLRVFWKLHVLILVFLDGNHRNRILLSVTNSSSHPGN